MKPAMQAIGFLLLGAAAAGIGAGVVIFRANMDMGALEARAADAHEKASGAERSAKALADEANYKLAIASQEIGKAQARIQALEEERQLVARAETLTRPKFLYGWKEYVSLPLGFTIKLPATTREPLFTKTSFDAGWIVVKPFDPAVVTSTETVYAVGNHLLIGERTPTSWRFRLQSNGTSTLMLLAYPGGTVSERTIRDALATLTFKDE